MKQKFIAYFISKEKEASDLTRYGLECLYILIEKTTFIILLALFLGIVKEVIITMIFMGFLRSHSFGFHFKNGKICLLISTLIFLTIGLSTKIEINGLLKNILSPFLIALIINKTPQDKKGRTITNKTKYKTITLIICIILYLIMITTNISNIAFLALLTQAIILKGGEKLD